MERLSRSVGVHLENPLCHIKPIHRNVNGGSPVPRVVTRHLHSGTSMPSGLQGSASCRRASRRATTHERDLKTASSSVTFTSRASTRTKNFLLVSSESSAAICCSESGMRWPDGMHAYVPVPFRATIAASNLATKSSDASILAISAAWRSTSALTFASKAR